MNFELSDLRSVIDEVDEKNGGDKIYTRLNFILNGSKKFYPKVCDAKENCSAGRASNDDLSYIFGHLGVQDILSVEIVSKSWHNVVQSNPIFWRNTHIDGPLSDKINDGILFKLTDKAHGDLQSLSLVNCHKITDSGLKRVLEGNKGLIKLGVSGCSRLTIEGIINNLKFLKVLSSSKIKKLRIGGISGVTSENFEELMSLLDIDSYKSLSAYKPWFYQGAPTYLSIDDDRVIDIEECPKCHHFAQVYDCSYCQAEKPMTCKACVACFVTCYNCGCCFQNREFFETFHFKFICRQCWSKDVNQ